MAACAAGESVSGFPETGGVRVLGYLAILGVVAAALLSVRAARPSAAAQEKRRARGRVQFGLGIVLLIAALALSLADVVTTVVAGCYVGGMALLVSGYLEGRFARRRPR